MQYLLHTHVAASAMRDVPEELRNVKQKADEKEDQYRKWLNEAILRCGNVHSEAEKVNLYVDGLSPKIDMVVAHHRETVHHCDWTFESLCHFNKYQDDSYCARLPYVTTSVISHQKGRRPTHMGSNRTILRRQGASNLPPTSNVKLMVTGEVVEEEDVLEVEEGAQATMETNSTAEPVQKSDEQH